MDVVQIFNDELESLLDIKPPVSKAKMGLITRAAIKGVKFYKHIVQSVENFISKCNMEYKVPGLYVIDSIVRQSQHQFGFERDVYAARFSRNIHTTFDHLFSGCSGSDKPKIIRVLNLWQINGVFNPQTIQPLLDLANPGSAFPINSSSNSKLTATSPSGPSMNNNNNNNSSSMHGHSSNHMRHQYSGHQRSSDSKFSKNMLDFDYDEEDDDDGDETPTEAEPPLSSTLSKIEMERRGQRNEMTNNNNNNNNNHTNHQSSQLHNSERQQQQAQPVPSQDPVLERWNRLIKQQSITNSAGTINERILSDGSKSRRSRSRSPPAPTSHNPPVSSRDTQAAPKEQQSNSTKDKSSSSSNTRNSSSTANSQSQSSSSSTSTSSTRNAEREAERQRKCLPKIKDKHLTVCSSTLWLGHVPKTVSEADISDAFGIYGTITSIDLIPPRGCAYVCMDRRQDAKRALSESKDLKLNGSHIKMAWAPGKGFKEYKKLKDFWEVDKGSSFIPYSKIDDSIDFDILEEGGIIDEDSMSMEMRESRERKAKEKAKPAAQSAVGPPMQPPLNLPMPTMPILSQPPPQTTIAPFSIPPPGLAMGVIPFPPPNVVVPTSASNLQMSLPSIKGSNDLQHENNNKETTDDGPRSPNSIDQQLSMTERQINMVEQQLSMIQQAQNINHHPLPPNSMAFMHHPQALFPQNHPNPMIFDMPPPPPQMLHGAQPALLDPNQLAMFANPSHILAQPPPHMLPTSQANMVDPNMNGNSMQQYHQY